MKGWWCTEEEGEAEVGVQRDDPLLPFWFFEKNKNASKWRQTYGEKSHHQKWDDTCQREHMKSFAFLFRIIFEPVSSAGAHTHTHYN
jgi:hypothetical protein